jgi:hypothetical protein
MNFLLYQDAILNFGCLHVKNKQKHKLIYKVLIHLNSLDYNLITMWTGLIIIDCIRL